MISSAEEFIRLRVSELPEEQHRATHEAADSLVWLEVIDKFPDFKGWVIHNKTIPLTILKALVADSDPNVRAQVARKRKIDEEIFSLLSTDSDEKVRYALMSNTKLTKSKISLIQTKDSEWLKLKLEEKLAQINKG